MEAMSVGISNTNFLKYFVSNRVVSVDSVGIFQEINIVFGVS